MRATGRTGKAIFSEKKPFHLQVFYQVGSKPVCPNRGAQMNNGSTLGIYFHPKGITAFHQQVC
jgi:hypothetical protein